MKLNFIRYNFRTKSSIKFDLGCLHSLSLFAISGQGKFVWSIMIEKMQWEWKLRNHNDSLNLILSSGGVVK